MDWRLERYDRDWTNIVDADGKVVAAIQALSNGRWIAGDANALPPYKRTFATVKEAFAWWKQGQ